MICIAIGLGVLGAVAFRRARRCHRSPWGGFPYYGHHHRRHHRHHVLYYALDRLDATPAQERFIVGELDKLTERLHAAKAGLGGGRGDLAAAIRASELDEAALGAALGRADTATAEARAAVVDALRAIHGVLDDGQRARIADLLDRGGAAWWRGPYR
jgi:hypothetical protein